MASLPTRQRDQAMILIVLCAVVAVAGYWMYVLTPRGLELRKVEEHVVALQDLNQKAKAELAKGGAEDLQRQAAEYTDHLRYMRRLVPTGNEVPALLEQVSTAARRVGLDIDAVQPEPVIQGPEFDTYRYNLIVRGSYHRLGEFLGNVGGLTRIVAPVNLALVPSNRARAAADPKKARRITPDESMLESTFQIQTYVAKVGAHPAAPDAEAKLQ